MFKVVSNNIIFIAGIHGVGKTTLCKNISKKLSIQHYSASELIRKLNSDKIRKDKIVKDVQNNQNVLLEAINKYLNNNQYYLLDGHFCLINRETEIEKVSIDVFKSIPIKEIIVLADEVENIAKKLTNRDTQEYSIDFIDKFQKKEITYAKFVAKQIGVGCNIFNLSYDNEKILEYISEVINITAS